MALRRPPSQGVAQSIQKFRRLAGRRPHPEKQPHRRPASHVTHGNAIPVAARIWYTMPNQSPRQSTLQPP
ncbi:MAG: hypothetical protein KF833_15295 [Verrucomicrobiae bacterium]|nr:hypothetical protein [Verrucomicrobiae bacterium]